MICLVTRNSTLADELREQLGALNLSVIIVSAESDDFLGALYRFGVSAAVVDSRLGTLPSGVCEDILNGLGQRMPVIVLDVRNHAQQHEGDDESDHEHHNFSDKVTLLRDPQAIDIIATLGACGVLGYAGQKIWRRSVPFYNSQIAVNMLKDNRGISVLTIDASNFRKLEMEYGTHVYATVKEIFQSILNDMWGKPGCFRTEDILCRRSIHGNTYYVFLNRSRTTGSLPLPGIVEEISDRLNRRIQNALWRELFADRKSRRIPDCVTSIPNVAVGYASALHNPCLEPAEIVDTVLDQSQAVARVQADRIRDRQRELMHTLIQGSDLLFAKFQAIFHLPKLTADMVSEAKKTKSIRGLNSELFGFESLIRVNTQALEQMLGGEENAILEPKFLRPDVLFSVAGYTKVSLELDQACLQQAAMYSKNLPGALMVNILPRNLYYIERLLHIFDNRNNIVFEVSESEAINNSDLMAEVREMLRKHNMGIAADDFGRGYAGLERVISIRPDMIKFDRSLIEGIHLDRVKQAYVRGLVRAAKLLNTTVLAEGVELWEEAEALQAMGIDLIQGFLLHMPQSVEEIATQIDLNDKDKDKDDDSQLKLDTVA